MNGIINMVQERCRDVRLVEDILALYDDCEAAAGIEVKRYQSHVKITPMLARSAEVLLPVKRKPAKTVTLNPPTR